MPELLPDEQSLITHDGGGTVSLSRVLTDGSSACHAGSYYILTISIEYKASGGGTAGNSGGGGGVVFDRVIKGMEF